MLNRTTVRTGKQHESPLTMWTCDPSSQHVVYKKIVFVYATIKMGQLLRVIGTPTLAIQSGVKSL